MLTSPAFWSAVVAVISSVTALVKLFQHQNGPQHNPPAPVFPSMPVPPPPPPPGKAA